jgi:hypothetical protein
MAVMLRYPAAEAMRRDPLPLPHLVGSRLLETCLIQQPLYLSCGDVAMVFTREDVSIQTPPPAWRDLNRHNACLFA